MRQLIDRMRDPVIAFDRDVRIATVNPPAERLFDRSASELIGHSTMQLRPVDHQLRWERNREIRELGMTEGVVECLDGSGEVFAVEFRSVRVGLTKAEGIEYMAVMHPTTRARISPVERLYTLHETAALLRKSTRSIRRMLQDGRLAGQKVGGTWRITESELERLIHGVVSGTGQPPLSRGPSRVAYRPRRTGTRSRPGPLHVERPNTYVNRLRVQGYPAVVTMPETATERRRRVVADNMRRIRAERGMTQKALAMALGTDREHVVHWENARYEPSAAYLERLADVLEVPQAEFYVRDQRRTEAP